MYLLVIHAAWNARNVTILFFVPGRGLIVSSKPPIVLAIVALGHKTTEERS